MCRHNRFYRMTFHAISFTHKECGQHRITVVVTATYLRPDLIIPYVIQMVVAYTTTKSHLFAS